jgi:hypothetical protein
MANYASGDYIPKNPQKYIGKYPVHFRSGYELPMFKLLDAHPSVGAWSSESISIPYRNPLTGKFSMYIPDLFVAYADKNNKQHCEVIEIKPAEQMPGYPGKVSSRTKLMQAINAAKWQAALVYCAKRNWKFRIMNEKQLFGYERK